MQNLARICTINRRILLNILIPGSMISLIEGAFASVSAQEKKVPDRASILLDAQQKIAELSKFRSEKDYQSAAALFTDSGSLTVDQTVFKGKMQIAEGLKNIFHISADILAHLSMPVVKISDDNKSVRAESNIINILIASEIYQRSVPLVVSVVAVTDVLELRDDQLKISNRTEKTIAAQPVPY